MAADAIVARTNLPDRDHSHGNGPAVHPSQDRSLTAWAEPIRRPCSYNSHGQRRGSGFGALDGITSSGESAPGRTGLPRVFLAFCPVRRLKQSNRPFFWDVDADLGALGAAYGVDLVVEGTCAAMAPDGEDGASLPLADRADQ